WTEDRDRVYGRLDSGMPVGIKVRLVGLTLGFEQRRGVLQKCHAERVRTGFYRNAGLQVLVYVVVRWLILFRISLVSRGRLHRERLHPLPIQQQLQLVDFAQALDVLVAVARQPNLDLVL